MTSFAATGWQEEDGTWVYYDRNEEKVTDKWAKSGDNWFYLDGDGYMATDMLIEDDEDYYYVDANGAMVRNQWIAIDNEDAGNDDNEPDVHWYYFQNNGKAYRKKGNTAVFKKSINGKTYCFNEDGQMQFGWVSSDDGQSNFDDTAWQDCDYYFGDQNDGAMSVGWRLISIVDENCEELQPGDAFWDEDQDRWFWFKSSGKKQTAADGETLKTDKTINGKKYGFDEYGRMVADWITDESVATATEATGTDAQGDPAYTKTFLYFSSPEDGARHTKGWFKVVPGYYLDNDKYEDGDSYWYYTDGKGYLYANEIKTIKSKKYLFNEYGRMQKGLVLVKFGTSGEYKKNVWTIPDDDSTYNYETSDDFDDVVRKNAPAFINGDMAFYFFSNDEDHDGSMKTGKQTVEIDGESKTFRFRDSGAQKGQGINGVKDKKVYLGGKMISAGGDEKIQFIDLTGKIDLPGKKYTVTQLMQQHYFVKVDKDNYTKYEFKSEPKDDTWVLDTDVISRADFAANFACVNTSGSILTSGTKKDGDDYKISLKKYSDKKTEIFAGSDTYEYTAYVEKVVLK